MLAPSLRCQNAATPNCSISVGLGSLNCDTKNQPYRWRFHDGQARKRHWMARQSYCLRLPGSHLQVLETEIVVDRVPELLFAAEILLSRLDGNMPEQKLYLFQLSTKRASTPGQES